MALAVDCGVHLAWSMFVFGLVIVNNQFFIMRYVFFRNGLVSINAFSFSTSVVVGRSQCGASCIIKFPE